MLQIPDDQGRLVTVTIPAVGPGIDFAVTVPDRVRWRIHLVFGTFTCGAAVANRIPILQIRDTTSLLWQQSVAVPQTANQVRNHSWTQVGNQMQLAGTERLSVPFPSGILVSAGFVINTAVQAIDAADQWTNTRIHVEEWIEP